MTQPATLPSATAQQQAAVEVFAQYEPPLYEAYLEMMVEWLAAVRVAMFAGGIVRLALVPDPLAVFSTGAKWAALTAKYTAKVAEEVLAAPYRDLFADGTVFSTRPFVQNWIAGTDNRLQQVPDQVFGLVSQIIDSATKNGASIPDVQDQVEQLFTDTGQQMWKNRARTVARTEVVGAYNGGLHDAFSMIAEADPDTDYVHRWLATDDQRTRPDHREADGQVQPWGTPFTLGGDADDPGGVLMMHPHSLGAPANQVVNCRCVELMEIKNEPTLMTDRQTRRGFSLAASAMTMHQQVCHDSTFCKLTGKPGLCKGQKRGGYHPGYEEETKKTPAQAAKTAVSGLNQAIAVAQAVAANNPQNPKLAAMAKRAIAGYKKALAPHQQKLKDAARADKQAKREGERDTRQQDTLDRRAQRQKETLKRRAERIIDRRKEQAKLAKMSPAQRTAYRKAKAAAAKKKREQEENKTLKEAAK